MGAVYRARQEAVGRDVALKIVRRERAYDAETKVRFEREARATSSLVSPHTVTVFDFGEGEDGSWYMAMELLVGETLGERLRKLGRLAIPDAVRTAREALKSLAEAHSKGIIHRDLKPDNLFLMQLPGDGGVPVEVCKVLDFGIAKLVRGDDQQVDTLETQAGTVFGTPRYMSPEQAQGVPLDARSDVYSLGVILYQMLAGRAPFVDDDAVVVMARHIKDGPARFVDVAPEAMIPPGLEAVVLRALSKRPEERQQTAEQLSAELEAALEQLGPLTTGVHATSWAGPPSGALAPPPRRSRVPLAVALAVGGTVLAGILGFFAVRTLASRSPATRSAAAPAVSIAPDLAPGAPTIDLDAPPAPAASAELRGPDAGKKKPKPHRPVWRGYAKPTATDNSKSPYGRFE
jgi:serine/threonine-protein kinase